MLIKGNGTRFYLDLFFSPSIGTLFQPLSCVLLISNFLKFFRHMYSILVFRYLTGDEYVNIWETEHFFHIKFWFRMYKCSWISWGVAELMGCDVCKGGGRWRS
jgi:hypothetical protein